MRQTVCFNMIVKDEAHVIERCLGSVKPYVDYWVIVDTGSTDGTQEIIRRFMEGVPGELHERPWKNFGHNRTEALRLARDKADYVLTIDADEIFTPHSHHWTWPDLTADSYMVEIRKGSLRYWVPYLTRNGPDWRYVGVAHEYLDAPDARARGKLEGVHVASFAEGARARDPLTYKREALVLEQGLLDEPDNARYRFYLAQTYRDCEDYDLAIRHYRKRIEMGGWAEEVWYSYLTVARCMDYRGDPWPEVLAAYLEAYQFRPSRAEPLYEIGLRENRAGRHAVAYPFLRRAHDQGQPEGDILFVGRYAYEFGIPLEYAVAAYWVGEHELSARINRELLARPDLPAHLRPRVEANLGFALERLGETAAA